MKRPNFFMPLAFIGMMFFTCGFALGLNPFLVPVLQQTLEVSSFQSYLIVAATFLPFLLWAYPAQVSIKKVGYKRTMALAFGVFALAFIIFVMAARYMNYPLFLLASFASGSANAILQAAINPYVTILGPIESAASRISVMGICNKMAWPLPSLFLVWLVGKQLDNFSVVDLFKPFYILIAIVFLLAIVCLIIPLPEVTAQGEDENTSADVEISADKTQKTSDKTQKTSVWQFPHVWLGALTLFLYVGVETVSLSTLVDYAGNLGLSHPADYGWIAPVGMVIGYICGVLFIPKYISQATALKVCSLIAIIGSVLVPLLPGIFSIYSIGLLALGCSLMWPALWPLALVDLGRFTNAGASLLTMSIVGGAVVPSVFGILNDMSKAQAMADGVSIVGSMQSSYWICLPCFICILLYGLWGYKIRIK